MKINPRYLFLIDGCGALLSAFLLGGVLIQFEQTFGMPRKVLSFLAGLACVFALYSFGCAIWLKETWRPFMRGIALINLSYCCLTGAMLFVFHQDLTALGIGYFVLEIAIILGLALFEWKRAATFVDGEE